MFLIHLLLKECIAEPQSLGDGIDFTLGVGSVLLQKQYTNSLAQTERTLDISSENWDIKVSHDSNVKITATRLAYAHITVEGNSKITISGPLICDIDCYEAEIELLIHDNIVPIISCCFHVYGQTLTLVNGGDNSENLRAACFYLAGNTYEPIIDCKLVSYSKSSSTSNIWFAGYKTTDLSSIIDKLSFIKGFDKSYDFEFTSISYKTAVIATIVAAVSFVIIWICCCCSGGCCCFKGCCCCMCGCGSKNQTKEDGSDQLNEAIIV